MIYLSHILDQNTPTYGNRNVFELKKHASISNGDVANDSHMSSTVHIGTHIDLPYHFYENGQTIESYEANFWIFKKPLIIELNPPKLMIKDELINKLALKIQDEKDEVSYDILIVKTGICNYRGEDSFWESNYGFHPDIYDYLIKYFPNIRIIGFDSISVSSFSNRKIGRVAHQKFLNPKRPILLLEDMKLESINEKTLFDKIIVSPLRIAKCDGLPCTVFGILND